MLSHGHDLSIVNMCIHVQTAANVLHLRHTCSITVSPLRQLGFQVLNHSSQHPVLSGRLLM